MKAKLIRYRRWGVSQFRYDLGLAYIGKRTTYKGDEDLDGVVVSNVFYQVGVGFQNLGIKHIPSMYFKIKKKPAIKNLLLINVILLLPYIAFLAIKLILAIVGVLGSALLYCLFVYIKDGLEDWGWGGRYLLLPIIFWQIVSAVLAAILLTN